MNENIIVEKSMSFAVRAVRLYQYLEGRKKERILSGQVCRSGTSIGANVREAIRAQSDADFLAKLQIALKETEETIYWLELLYKTEYINEKMYRSMLQDCTELRRILISIIRSKKENMMSAEKNPSRVPKQTTESTKIKTNSEF